MPATHVSWEDFPENLGIDHEESKWYNLAEQNANIRLHSRKLFVEDENEIAVKVFNYSATLEREKIFRKETEFLTYLDDSSQSADSRVFLIRQQGSWGALAITQPAIRKLLSQLRCSPAIVNALRAFGRRTDSVGESHVHFSSRTLGDKSRETSYILKHSEEHGRPQTNGEWSIRQIGAYCQVNPSNAHTVIIINPSTSLQKQLERFLHAEGKPSFWNLQRAILSSPVERWRWYINDVEAQYLDMKTKAQLTHVDEKGIHGNLLGAYVRFEDTQDVQVLQDECYQILHCLDLNSTIVQKLLDLADEEVQNKKCRAEESKEFLENLATELEIERKRVHSILRRLDATIALIRTILDFQSLASLRANSSAMKDLAEASSGESRLMTELTKKTSKDTEVVRTLTLLALIYLPASFVSSMMGMDYIHVTGTASKLAFHFQGEFWVFVVLTALLLVFTFFGYYRKVRQAG